MFESLIFKELNRYTNHWIFITKTIIIVFYICIERLRENLMTRYFLIYIERYHINKLF